MITTSSNSTAARRMRAVCILASLLMVTITGIAADGLATGQPVSSANAAPAVNTSTTPTWAALSPAQKKNLSPLSGVWDTIDGVRKVKWLAIERKLSNMRPEDQLRMQERMRKWAKLSPEQRRVARENYTKSKKLDRDKKSAQWQEYQQLSEEQKKKLAASGASKKHVANLPPAKSKNKTLPPIKTTPKDILEKSVTPDVTNKLLVTPSPTPANK